MIKFVILSSIFAALNFVFASSNINSLISSGVSSAYNFNFDESETSFQKIVDQFPEDPRGYYYLSQNHLWFYLGSRDEGELRIFEQYTNIAFEKLEQIADSVEDNPKFIELEANLYLQKAMVAGAEESTLDAFFATKSAYSKYEDVLEIDSSYSRAYLGLGLLEYALSYVPGFFKWALTIAGLGSDKEKGFALIQKALTNADSNAELSEVNYHYSKMLLEYMGDPQASIIILEKLIDQYPGNILFRYQIALAHIEAKELPEAFTHLQKIIQKEDSRFIQTIAFSYFLIAEIDFRFGRYTASITNYEKFLELSRGFEYSGMAYYNIALSHLFLQDMLNARKYLVLARNGNSDIPDDLYAARRSEVIFNSLKKTQFLHVVKSRNYLQSADYESLFAYLSKRIDSLKNDNKIEARIIIAEAYLLNNKLNEAKKQLSEINVDNIETEYWLEAYFYYLSAWVALESVELGKFETNVEKAIDKNSYDYIDKITAKINYLRFNKAKTD